MWPPVAELSHWLEGEGAKCAATQGVASSSGQRFSEAVVLGFVSRRRPTVSLHDPRLESICAGAGQGSIRMREYRQMLTRKGRCEGGDEEADEKEEEKEEQQRKEGRRLEKRAREKSRERHSQIGEGWERRVFIAPRSPSLLGTATEYKVQCKRKGLGRENWANGAS